MERRDEAMGGELRETERSVGDSTTTAADGVAGQSGGEAERAIAHGRDDDRGSGTGRAPVGARLVGEGVGEVTGIAAGAAIGSAIAGPVGTVIGALAGAVGGWWAGKEAADAVAGYGDEDDRHYRNLFTGAKARLAQRAAEERAAQPMGRERAYDDARPAYQLGHLAKRNPAYTGKSFEDVEPELQRGWSDDVRARHGEWSEVRDYVGEAYRGTRDQAGADREPR
jgi:hypothetical protein